MHKYEFTAAELYKLNPTIFWRIIPDCSISICFNCTQMFLNLRELGKGQTKTKRRQAMALILRYASAEDVQKLLEWLGEYFAQDIQIDIFELRAFPEVETYEPIPALEKELQKIRKR